MLTPRSSQNLDTDCPDEGKTAYHHEKEETESATRAQVEFGAAIAYLLGSPLQRSQPTGYETVQSSCLLVNQLLEYGVDPERIVALILGQ